MLCIASALLIFAALTALQSPGQAQTGGGGLPQIARGGEGDAQKKTYAAGQQPIWPGGSYSSCSAVVPPSGTWMIQSSFGGTIVASYQPATATAPESDSRNGWNMTASGHINVPSNAMPGTYLAKWAREDCSSYAQIGAGTYWQHYSDIFEFVVPGSATPTPPTPTGTGTPPPTPTWSWTPPPTPSPYPTIIFPWPPPPSPSPTMIIPTIPPPTPSPTMIIPTIPPTPSPTMITPTPPTLTPTETPRFWNVYTPVGEQGDGGGNGGFGTQSTVGASDITAAPPIQNGQMVQPQNQKVLPYTPAAVVVALGATVPCEVEAATDEDEWTKGTQKGVSPDVVSYKWTAVDSNNVPAGSFANDTALSTTWTAPTTADVYSLKCRIDDLWLPGQKPDPDDGDRNDAAVERTVQVYITKVKFVEDPQQKYGFDDGTYYKPAIPIPQKSVEVAQSDTVIAEITSGTNSTSVTFQSSNISVMTVAPGQASTTHQTVTLFGGSARGTADATAHIGAASPSSTLFVNVYKKRTYKIGVVLVVDKNNVINATDIPEAGLEADLRKIFKQAVVDFEFERLDPLETPLDFDAEPKDGLLQVNQTGVSSEMAVIIQAYDQVRVEKRLDKIIYLTANPSKANLGGVVVPVVGSRDAFVFTNKVGALGTTIAAHELGHALGLLHTGGINAWGTSNGEPQDLTNLMHPSAISSAARLRRFQWYILNPPTQ